MIMLTLIGFVLAISAKWAYDYFGLSCFEQIVFHLKVPLEGVNPQVYKDWGKQCFLKGVAIGLGLWILEWLPFLGGYYDVICKFVFACCMVYALFKVEIVKYIVNQFRTTDLYEKFYVDGKTVNIAFTEKKRNLILLYAESMETTYTSK